MLAARDQELRTLTAEGNQLQSELRLARSLIAERDYEIQSVCATNNQYVEENERLRAILGEWSTRAAKLERALDCRRRFQHSQINQIHQQNLLNTVEHSHTCVECFSVSFLC
ncbi:hypothetical protein ACB094_07G003600 [Castanea mollissima]